MKKEQLLEAIDGVADSYIAEADADRKNNKKRNISVVAGIAACVCILCTAVFLLPGRSVLKVNTAQGDTVIYKKGDSMNADALVPSQAVSPREMTAEETEKLFGFRGEGIEYLREDNGERLWAEGSFDNLKISFHYTSQVQKDTVIGDYDAKSSLSGVEVRSGYFVTDANSRGERSVIFYSEFTVGEVTVNMEYSTDATDKKSGAQAFTEDMEMVIRHLSGE